MSEQHSESKPKGAKSHNFGRPCIVTDKDYKTGETRTRKATFHIFGYQRQGGKDGPPAMQTVAIVELEDGRITSKRPDSITFIDKQQGA